MGIEGKPILILTTKNTLSVTWLKITARHRHLDLVQHLFSCQLVQNLNELGLTMTNMLTSQFVQKLKEKGQTWTPMSRACCWPSRRPCSGFFEIFYLPLLFFCVCCLPLCVCLSALAIFSNKEHMWKIKTFLVWFYCFIHKMLKQNPKIFKRLTKMYVQEHLMDIWYCCLNKIVLHFTS